MTDLPSLIDVRKAAARIEPYASRTPVYTSSQINHKAGCEVFFKCENFQRTGAFKFRGACNALFSLSGDLISKGVATHSSGNHAQAVSLAAKIRGVPAYIVMPANAPGVKIAAVKSYGAQITFCEPVQESRESVASELVKQTGAHFIHPYNNPDIIAGQGTAAFELLEEIPEIDTILAPVGGGGLISGTAIASKALKPGIKVIGAEPAMADDAYRSFKAGKLIQPETAPVTVADGLRTSLGDLTFAVISKYADDIVTVSEKSIIQRMKFIWERMNFIIEPSSAVPVSALLDKKIKLNKSRKVGVIISGGNIDLDNLPWTKG